MKRRNEKTVTGGTVKVLIQESQEDLVHVLAHGKANLSHLTPAVHREVVQRE
jgi:hypothetical protein